MAATSSSISKNNDENSSRLKIQNANMDNRSLDNLNNTTTTITRGLTPVDSHPLMLQLSPTGSIKSSDSIEYAATTNLTSTTTITNNTSTTTKTYSAFPDLVPPNDVRNHNEEVEENEDVEEVTNNSSKHPPTSLPLDVVHGGVRKKIVIAHRLKPTSSTESDDKSTDLSQYQATVGPSLDSVQLSSKVLKGNLLLKPSSTASHMNVKSEESSSPETPSEERNCPDEASPDSSIFGDVEPPKDTNTRDRGNWVKITLPDGKCREIDMRVIEPYMRILSHGGYYNKNNAIIIFSSCFLPDRSRSDYHYVMANLFLYVIKTLQQLITEDYVLIYFHGGSHKNNVPPFRWLKKCYQLIDRRLRKSLKAMYLVHPSFWLKSMVWMLRPFVSTKFWRKMVYVQSLEELYKFVDVEKAAVPDKVKQFDSKHS